MIGHECRDCVEKSKPLRKRIEERIDNLFWLLQQERYEDARSAMRKFQNLVRAIVPINLLGRDNLHGGPEKPDYKSFHTIILDRSNFKRAEVIKLLQRCEWLESRRK